jgi:hypothetical protein
MIVRLNFVFAVHPDSTMDVQCCLRSGELRQYSNGVLLFKVAAPSHHYLLA